MSNSEIKVLAVASSGGHWIQLNRLRDFFEDFNTVYVTTDSSYASEQTGGAMHIVEDANRNTPFKILKMFSQVARILITEKPSVVVTTGAAPGLFAIILAKCFGAKTIWIDSIANAEQLSLSGKIAGTFATLWLTQWEHLATEKGPKFRGSVI